jgi:phenylacetate-CoA ligase
MKLNEIVNKSVNRFLIWKFIRKKKKHTALVSRHIDNLYNYHKKEIQFNFSPLRKKLLTGILVNAKRNCRYYKDILPDTWQISNLDYEKFKSIPLLTKDLIRVYSQDLKSVIVPDSCLSPMKTSGSTGNPLAFFASGNTDHIHQKFLYNLYNYKTGDKILAMDGTTVEDKLIRKGIFWKVKNEGNMLPYGGMALSALYLTKKTIPGYVDFILSYKPEFIRGYPSFITEIAQYILRNKIPVEFQMKAIELTSELASDWQVKSIAEAFHCKVSGQYGHKEASIFGYTVEDSFTYYCSPFYGFTEVLDEYGQHVGVGEEGEIIVTGFSNFGMPFIRYKTGDRASYGGEENGLVKLNQVLGRTSNYILNYEAEKTYMTSFNFGRDCQALARITQWQVIQNVIGELIINIHSIAGYSQEDEYEIVKIFQKAGKIKCDFVYNQEFVKTNAGKKLFVIQNVSE